MGTKILILDTGTPERGDAAEAVREAGYKLVALTAGPDDLELPEPPAAVVIGGEMADDDALRLVRQLRSQGWHQPILVRGRSDTPEACVAALEAGADDFVGRGRGTRELLARLQVLLRRRTAARPVSRFRIGRMTFDLGRMEAAVDGKVVPLTKTELSVLVLLLNEGGRAVRREAILRKIWGHADGSQTRTLETHIWRLRKKIGDDGEKPRWLRNHPGIGYSIAAESVSGP